MFSKISHCAILVIICALLMTANGAPPPRPPGRKYDVFVRPPLLEGDIAGLLPTGTKFSSAAEEEAYLAASAKNGVINNRWPGSRMPYTISDAFTAGEKNAILKAVAEINRNATRFKIVPRSTETNYVFVSRGAPQTGCYSYIGKIGGRQLVNLEAPGCVYHGIIVHELIHAVGFYHEQARTDRDSFVEVNWSNIPQSQQHNFRKYAANFVTDFNLPYDYDSIMHYGKYDFAIDRRIWTIRPKQPNQNLSIGQRRGMNPKDMAKLNAMYKN